MDERHFQFEWDEAKAAANARKHGVSFDLARTIFNDPFLLTVADLEHSAKEERWFSVGRATNGLVISAVYLWSETMPLEINIRIISARKATRAEIHQYEGRL